MLMRREHAPKGRKVVTNEKIMIMEIEVKNKQNDVK